MKPVVLVYETFPTEAYAPGTRVRTHFMRSVLLVEWALTSKNSSWPRTQAPGLPDLM
jgi:hypothetical protein